MTCDTKKSDQWDVVDRVDIFLSSTLMMQNLVAVCHSQWAYVGCLKVGHAGQVPLGMRRAWLTH